MKFPGTWISPLQGGVRVEFATFDETDLPEASNWTEAHQNADATLPAGYVDPARIVAEVGRKLLEVRPELPVNLGDRDAPIELRTLEDYGRLCLGMSEWIATMARARTARPASKVADREGDEEISS